MDEGKLARLEQVAELNALSALLVWEAALVNAEVASGSQVTHAPDREVARRLHGSLVALGVLPREPG